MSEEKQYPSLPEQGKNLAKFAWDVINESLRKGAPLQVSDSIYNERLEICKSCEYYDKNEIRCKECGCWLEHKARWSLDSCPIGKWSANSDTFINEKFEELMKDLDKEKESE